MNSTGGLSASTMRIVFITLFIMSLAGFASLYYFGNDYLSTKSQELHNTLTSTYSSSSGASLDSKSRAIVAESATLLTKINSVYASSGNYQQTTTEVVRSFATKANFPIDNINFQIDSSNANTKAFEIKTNNPVDYTSFINFVIYIEKALPKMKITKMNISADKANPSKIEVNNLTLEVYVK